MPDKKGAYGSGGGEGYYVNKAYDNLRGMAENAGEGETAGDIIRRWRGSNS